MNGKDLGTYHLRVVFADGRGYIQEWSTGMRFTNGSESFHPLDAMLIRPTWESEEDLFSSMIFMYLDGNYSCDCNRSDFLDSAHQVERPEEYDSKCGDEMKLRSLTAIRPDGSEKVIWDNSENPQSTEQTQP